MSILSVIKNLIPTIGRTIEKAVTNKDAALKLKNDIETLLIGAQSSLVDAQSKIIVAEAQGASWIQRNWRPITMLTFVFIIANNYIFVPYAVAMTGGTGGDGASLIPMLDIPPGMWSLLTVGIGGYIGGRSYEKVAKIKADSSASKP